MIVIYVALWEYSPILYDKKIKRFLKNKIEITTLNFVLKKGVELQQFCNCQFILLLFFLFYNTPVRLEYTTLHILEFNFLIYSVEFREP